MSINCCKRVWLFLFVPGDIMQQDFLRSSSNWLIIQLYVILV